MKKRFWAALLPVAAVLCLCFGIAACGKESGNGGTTTDVGTEGSQFQKRKDEQGGEYFAVVGLGTSEEIEIVIPAIHGGLPVKEIGTSAFRASTDARNASLISISIPDSVTRIGDSAFSGCVGLKEITIPHGVTSIGSYAFERCSGLTGELKIPDGVTSIGSSAFEDCSGLTGELKIPDGVTSIGGGAFNRIRDTAKNQKNILKRSLSRA